MYFSVTPDTGSYVFNVNVARVVGGVAVVRATSGVAAVVEEVVDAAGGSALVDLEDLDFTLAEGGINVYFVEMRV